MEQKLHTPEGVRDIYSNECRAKLAVQDKLHQVLHLYGYQDIQTPTFEYFDVFRKEIGTISSRELYKFFDREGDTLALRPDITPSIARAAATLFETEDFPIRLCYVGSTFINHSSYQGRLKESTQLGAELIGIDSVEADAEMIAMVVDGLKKVGLKEFQVNIGHVDFLQSLMEATGLSKEKQEEIYNLIANRNFFGVEELLEQADASPELKETFRLLPEFAGDVDVLKKAVEHAPTDQAKQAVGRLLKIYKLLALYGADDYVTFDLSMSGHYGYYTGIVFRVYTYGTGDAIVTGGRYDHLLEKFGKQTPSIGFAIIIDELQNALSRQKITVETGHNNLIVYTDATEKWAIALAKDFREKGKYMELLKRTEEDSKETFIAYGKRTHAVSMLYLNENLTIDMVNLSTGEEKKVNARKKRKRGEQMKYLTFALTKGRLASKTLEMLEQLGITCEEMKEKDSRKLVFVNEELKLKFFLAKGPDVPTYVEYGAADIGVVGKDTIVEEGRNVHEVLDLGFGSCRMCVCGPQDAKELLEHREVIRVATKYPKIAKDYFYNKKHQTVEIIKMNGSIELAPIVGLSEVIVDIVETGSTLKENGLTVLEEVCPLSARMIVNPVSMRMENDRIRDLIGRIRNLLEGETV